MEIQDDPQPTKNVANGETQIAKKGSSEKASLGREFDIGVPTIENAFGAILVQDGDFWKRGKGVWVRYHNIPRKAFFTPTGTQDGPDWRNLGLRRITFVTLVMVQPRPSRTIGTRGVMPTRETDGLERQSSLRPIPPRPKERRASSRRNPAMQRQLIGFLSKLVVGRSRSFQPRPRQTRAVCA